MANYKAAFINYLDHEGIKYRDIDEFRVTVGYNADNSSFDIQVFFNKDGDGYVALRCWNIGKFADDKFPKALLVCNDMNNKYRWVKFYIDSDYDVAASVDAIVDQETVGPEVLELIRRMVNICDEAYPSFMKIKWA